VSGKGGKGGSSPLRFALLHREEGKSLASLSWQILIRRKREGNLLYMKPVKKKEEEVYTIP